MSEGSLTFKDDLWDSFETICGRLKQATAFQRSFTTLMSSYAKETREYARKILILAKTKDEEELYSLNTGYLGTKQELDKMANLFLKLADDLTYKVSQPVENHLKETQKIKRKGKETGRRLIADLTESIKVLSTTKGDYEKAMRVYDQSKADAERAANLNELYNSTKVKKKVEADKKRAEAAEKKYRRTVQKTQQLETKLFDTDMPRILSEFEEMERTRVTTMKSSLGAFASSYIDLMPLIEACCGNINTHVQMIDPDGDVNQFILDKKTGKNKETHRTEFEEYNSQYKACLKEGAVPAGASPYGSANNSPAMQRANSTVSAASMSSVATQNAMRSSQPNMSPIDITKKQDPTIRNSMHLASSQSMSSGNLNQYRSADTQNFQAQPSHQQSFEPVPMAPSPTPPTSSKITFCRGLHDYVAQQPSELSFRRGDIIKVLEKDTSGWWAGELNGKMGFFPSVEWVEEISGDPQVSSAPPVNRESKVMEAPQPVTQYHQQHQNSQVHPPQQQAQQVPQSSFRRCRALFPMEPQNPNELQLITGDIIMIEKEADGWYLGTNTRGQRGIFPASFVILE